MKAIIVEDEVTAIRKLEQLLKKTNPDIEVVARLESVKETVKWIKTNEAPDIGFFDIQLSDATSFDVFEQCDVKFPVIFVTAYDDYLLRAFELNSVHYLLKPISAEKVNHALQKVKNLKEHFIGSSIRDLFNEPSRNGQFRQRLIVRKGMDSVPMNIEEIAYVFTEHKMSFAKAKEGDIYMVDKPLSEIEKELDPTKFFRANRQYLVNIDAITRFRSIEHSKVALELEPKPKEAVVIGKENAVAFRKWVKS